MVQIIWKLLWIEQSGMLVNESNTRVPGKRKSRERFEERVAILLEELKLAIKWHRSSILFAVYGSEYLRQKVQDDIWKKMTDLGQTVYHIDISDDFFDIPVIFSKYPERRNSVFFISGLRWGGGTDGRNAYRSLNLRREYFTEERIRVIFWLTQSEAGTLPRLSPDFWSFRNRVVEFIESPAGKRSVLLRDNLIWPGWKADYSPENIGAEIEGRQQILASLPQGNESRATRADVYYELAAFSWAKGEYIASLAYLNQGRVNAQFTQDRPQQARFLVGLGFICHELKQLEDAVAYYKKALELLPTDTSAWSNLSNAYRDLGRITDAIEASKKAIKLAPEDAANWNSLGNIFRDRGRMEDAIIAYENAIRLDSRVGLYWINLGTIYHILIRFPEAMAAYQNAIKLSPTNGLAYVSLAACYRKSGDVSTANTLLKTARDFIDEENQYAQACFKSVNGNVDDALELIETALQRGQTKVSLVRTEPDFDFLRDDARFQELLQDKSKKRH